MPTLKHFFLACLLVVLFFLSITPSLAQPPSGETTELPPFVPGEIVVKFRPTVNARQRQTALATTGLQALSVSPYSGVLRLRVTPGQEAAMIAALRARSDVEFAEVNAIVTAFGSPNDADFAQQWGMHNTGLSGGSPDADIDAPAAWDLETGSSDVIVAILDTGVDLDHPDLQAHIWSNADEIPGNSLDDDNNGFVDDINGWDFCASFSFSNCVSQDNDPNDLNGHGSHVAGIAAAVGNNGQGVTGVSQAATIMPVKVLASSGSGTATSIANGIDYAVANGVDVINLSLGGSTYPCTGFTAVLNAIQNALLNNVLVVAASGNNNDLTDVSCPAAFDETLAVGATNHNDDRWEWNSSQGSNGGSRLDVVAPGGSETGASNETDGIYSTLINGAYGYKSGTSMSAPHVTGLAALLLAYNSNLSATDVRSVIEATTDDLGPAGFDAEFGQGRINARQALEALVSFQSAPAHLDFSLTDAGGGLPVSGNLQLTSAATGSVTWTATISPAVSWLTVSPTTGTFSAATSPTTTTLTATQPPAYGVYSTTVILAASDNSGASLGTRSTSVTLTYSAGPAPTPTATPSATTLNEKLYLPLILK